MSRSVLLPQPWIARCGMALLLIMLGAPLTAQGQIVDNGCPNQLGAPQPNCSKLAGGERITVMATECGYSVACPGPSALICRSVINDGSVDYFVPWKTLEEWGAFLRQLTPMSPMAPGAVPLPPYNLAVSNLPNVSVGACCPQQKVPDVCPGYPCTPTTPGYPNCSSVAAHGLPDELGYRRVGTRNVPEGGYTLDQLKHFGAQNDIYGPIKSADFFGDSTINYEVTYTCNQGSWVKSYEIGSCTPVAGACNSAIPQPLPNGWTLPTDLNQLCDVPGGSTIIDGSLVDTGPTYTWKCKGTPTMADADCTRTKYVAPLAYNGVCGPAHNGHLPAPPASNPDKCVSGDVGILTGSGTDANPWKWSCSGGNGGSSQNCKAYLLGTPLAGICGPANGYVATNASWAPTADQLCNRTSAAAVPVATGASLDWTCFGQDGGADTPCNATLLVVNGACGVPNSYVVTTPPHMPPVPADLPPNACASGTPANITYNSGTQTLSWICVGANGGGSSNCSAHVDTTLIKGKCMWSNGTVLSYIPPATSAALCATGTADNVVTAGTAPTIAISWDCLGNQAGYDASCAIAVQLRVDGQCGVASGKTLTTKPSGAALCNAGTPSVVSGGATGPTWGWTCAGLYGGVTDYCGAIYDTSAPGSPTPVNGLCDPTRTVPMATAPSAPLCSVGVPTTVNGTGPWTWQCLGLYGGVDVPCLTPLLGAAACGLTNGTRIPNKPNANLCAPGTPSPVLGDNISGWDWSCSAIGIAYCHADPCDVCTGDLAAAPRNDGVAEQTINYGSGSCEVSGTVNWQEVDKLGPGNTTYTLSIGNSASGLSFSRSQLPSPGPANYCTPCYRTPKTISSASFTVQKVTSGVCTTGTALDGGSPLTLPATTVTITP